MPRMLTAMMLTLSLALLPACGGGGHDDHDHGHADDAFKDVKKAVCVLTPTNNADLPGVSGVVTLTQTPEGLLVEADVTGLKPDAKHGFHIHMFGDISKPDGTGTGGHYDPTGVDHGLPGAHGGDKPMETGGHAGDFGNLAAGPDGKATYSQTFTNITLTGKNAVLGRGIIVHLNEDDGSQPTGNAGPRVAQGVIGVADAK